MKKFMKNWWKLRNNKNLFITVQTIKEMKNLND